MVREGSTTSINIQGSRTGGITGSGDVGSHTGGVIGGVAGTVSAMNKSVYNAGDSEMVRPMGMGKSKSSSFIEEA